MKKILAVVLCLTLCVVGLPFSASAAFIQGDEIVLEAHDHMTRNPVCDCGVSYNLVNYGGSYVEQNVGSASVCYRRIYDVVRGQCPICKQLADFHDVIRNFSHSEFENIVENNVIYQRCTRCGYER